MCLIQYNRKQLLDLRNVQHKLVRPDNDTLTLLKLFNLLRYRNAWGCKKHSKRKWDTNFGVNLKNIKAIPEAITVITSIRNYYNKQESMESHNHKDIYCCCCNNFNVAHYSKSIKVIKT